MADTMCSCLLVGGSRVGTVGVVGVAVAVVVVVVVVLPTWPPAALSRAGSFFVQNRPV